MNSSLEVKMEHRDQHPLRGAAPTRSLGWLRFLKSVSVSTFAFSLAFHTIAVPRAVAEIPPAHRVKVLLTALSFNKTMKQRATDKITIGILGKCKTATALQEAVGKAINGLPIAVQLIGDFESEGALEQAVKKFSVTALYLCEANDAALSAASALAAKQKIVTLAEDPDWVEDKIVLGVGEKAGRAELVINMSAAKAAGADFDARIFGVARVIQ